MHQRCMHKESATMLYCTKNFNSILPPYCVVCCVELFTGEMRNSFAYLDKLLSKFLELSTRNLD